MAHLQPDDPAFDLDVSDSLRRREVFVRDFAVTGELERDLARFLSGVGQAEVVELTRAVGGTLHEVASHIVANHRRELARLSEGAPPRYVDGRLSVPQRHFYRHLLQLEAEVLERILAQA